MTTAICDLLGTWSAFFPSSAIFAVTTTILFWCLNEYGIRESLVKFISEIKKERQWRYRFLFLMYAYFVLDRTLLSRSFEWTNGMKSVLSGGWGFHAIDTGQFTLEAVENFLFFMPLVFLMFASFFRKVRFNKCIKASFKIGFCTSMFIELNQMLFKIGEFQVADLVYNTSGAVMGGVLYWLISSVC